MYTIGGWELTWLGHDSFRLSKGAIIVYIDPLDIMDGPQADYILITHNHYDHFDRKSIDRLRKINAVIIGPKAVTDQLDDMAITLLPGETYEGTDFTVKAVPAYNTDKTFHPKEDNNLGYTLNLSGEYLYHAGDTDVIPEMAELGQVDVALLPVSGIYVMTAEQAVEATKIIKPRIAIPMHYGFLKGTDNEGRRYGELAKDLTDVVILEKTQ